MEYAVVLPLNKTVLNHTWRHSSDEGFGVPKLVVKLKNSIIKINFQVHFILTWLFHPAVMVRINAYIALFQPVRVLAAF